MEDKSYLNKYLMQPEGAPLSGLKKIKPHFNNKRENIHHINTIKTRNKFKI